MEILGDILLAIPLVAILAAGVAGVGSEAYRRGMPVRSYVLLSIFLTPLAGILKLYYDSSKGGRPVFPAPGPDSYSRSAFGLLAVLEVCSLFTLWW